MTNPDQIAADKIIAARPAWVGLIEARDAFVWPSRTLLHAGPPYNSIEQIVRPVRNAAIHAAQFEGWAASAEEADAKIASGEIQLRPAQDFGICVPLAFVLSPSMWLQKVEDLGPSGSVAFAPINAGMTLPLAHGGSDDPATIERHQWTTDVLVPLIQPLLSMPIEILPIIDESLSGGDECHGRTGIGTAVIRQIAAERLPAGSPRQSLLSFLDTSPGFYLFLMMAAAKVMMMAAEGTSNASIITSAGGNGAQFGIKLADRPTEWFAADCDAPKGPFFDGQDVSRKYPLGGIGDSAVIDALGLGGMALSRAPELAGPLAEYAEPGDPAHVLEVSHPKLLEGSVQMALSARRVVQTNDPMRAVLGILDAKGKGGIIGRGLFSAPIQPFQSAINAIG